MSSGIDTALQERVLRDMDEPLCDELRACLIDMGDFIALRHPLVVDIAPIGGACNRRLRHKRQLLADPAYARLSKRIWLYERPFRLDKICGWVDAADEADDDVREALAMAWMDMESDDADPDIVDMCVGAFRKVGFITQDADVIACADDAAAVRLYRGGANPNGMAWSSSREVAEFFAAREARGGGERVVWEARCDAEGALAYLTGRQEYEIVCDPAYVRVVGRVN